MTDQVQDTETNTEDKTYKNWKEWTQIQDEHCGMTCNRLVIWQFILVETPMNDGSGGGDSGNILEYHNNSYRMNTFGQKMSLHGKQFL